MSVGEDQKHHGFYSMMARGTAPTISSRSFHLSVLVRRYSMPNGSASLSPDRTIPRDEVRGHRDDRLIITRSVSLSDHSAQIKIPDTISIHRDQQRSPAYAPKVKSSRRQTAPHRVDPVFPLIRTVIHEVIADIDPEAAEIVLVVHWIGGVHSEMRLPRRRRGQRNSTSADVIAAVRQLALIANDDLIAGILNRNGLVAGNGNRWTRERVTSLRSHHRISVYKPADDGIEPWLNLSNAARLLHISPRTLRLAAQAGEIDAIHPLPDGPWIFSRAALSTSSARGLSFVRARTLATRVSGSVSETL